MKKEYNHFDIIVIGAGSGGLNIAGFMNRIGLKVLLIDKNEENIGGDCLNTGCVPSKALIHIAREIYTGKKVEGFGLNMHGVVDIKKVMEYVKEKQAVIRVHENSEHFRNIGMTVLLGTATFSGPRSVMVNGAEYYGKKIIIATGSRPRKLELEGLELIKTYTNETVFDMETLPSRFVFIGGGPISLELGQAFAMLGSAVTIVHGGKHILEKEDLAVSTFMEAELTQMGVELILDAKPLKIDRGPEGEEVVVATPTGEKRIPVNALFIGIGRVLNIENLDLTKANIGLTAAGRNIVVDEYLRTTNPHVYTAGDVAGGLMFTHAAELHASTIISNFFKPFKKKLNIDSFGWVTYTSPEIATFGLSAKDLKNRQIQYEEVSSSLLEDDRAIVDESRGFLKLFVGPKGTLLGGTLVAPQAGEIIGELLLAKSNGLTLEDLFNRVAPYPTASRIIRKTAGLYQSKKLTTKVKKLLRLIWLVKYRM
jgi:pyruvate/2-oxoglutarate dehydrogenase complex dihydrolipoamide dehydrogenase (E3) component